jgi:hypothetical protein
MNANLRTADPRPTCPPNCGHTQAEHDAFDSGLQVGNEGLIPSNPYDTPSLREAWESGYSVGQINHRTPPPPAPVPPTWQPKIGDWFILKGSYCGADNTIGCTDATPCPACLEMSNRFIIAGEHYGTFFFNPQFCTRGSGIRLDETCCGVIYTGDTAPTLHPKEGPAHHISETVPTRAPLPDAKYSCKGAKCGDCTECLLAQALYALDAERATKSSEPTASKSGGDVHLANALARIAELEQDVTELNAIREYLWPNQTGLPNKHRNCLVAIEAREKLLHEQIAAAHTKTNPPEISSQLVEAPVAVGEKEVQS